ncbi:helix-turn-helix transcriptional regulator [Treponema sp.]|uniref:helix-turn-helix domain-containing protein n=1 Tax=Treponema sp. TaxID=166 RepID=UPI0025E21339|nr:helix-turn-helix transcriptional regulator [Treponema sp.]MBR4323311.1 helix-turn-helix transcriptional regulator [Treponema sp.]MBR4599255.1 helix-turn-helix transcriptional regulator [Treponema sp.]
MTFSPLSRKIYENNILTGWVRLMTRIQECLAQNIKKYRKLRNLTQEQLGVLAETSTNYIGTIEIGKRFPSPQTIEKLAAVFKIDPPLLFLPEYITRNDDKSESFAEQKIKLKNSVLLQLSNAVEKAFEE